MEALTAKEQNTVAVQNTITGELAKRWAGYVDASEKTKATYDRAIKQFISYLAENEVAQPTRETVIAYRDSLKETHKPATVQLYLQAIRLFFQWTAYEGIYPNVAEHIKGAKLTREHKKDYLTSRQAKKLVSGVNTDSLEGLRDYAIITLMLTTGLRTIEVVRANIEDLRTVADFTALFVEGKGREDRTEYVKVPEVAEEAIRQYLKARGEKTTTSPLFASVSNRNLSGRMTTRSVSRIVKNHLVSVGLDSDRLTAHSLRHTTATLNLLAGGTIEETAQMLRHRNTNTTLIYSHALERAKNDSEGRVARAIFG